MDFSKTLPFENESIQVIIADLSLHYFNDKTTKSVVKEIKRVLKKDGYIIGRVNKYTIKKKAFEFVAGK